MRAKYLVSAVATLAVAGAVCTAWMSTHPSANGVDSSSSQAYAASPSVSSGRGTSASAHSLPVRQWTAGATFLYSVDTARGASVGGSSQAGQKVLARLAGSLALTVIGQDASGAQIRAELRSPRREQTPRAENDSTASLVKPFYFKALRTGEMTAFYFAKDVPGEDRILLKGLTTSLQIVAPVDAGEAWQSTEQDVSGEYEAAYRIKGGVVHKAKEKYLRARGQAGLIALPGDSVYTVTSAIDFEIDTTGWPRAVTEDETLDVKMQEIRVVATSKTTARLVSVESHPELAGAVNLADFDPDVLSAAAASALAKKQADKGLVDGKTFKQLGVELASSDVHVRNRTQARMAALFRVDPGAPREAEEAILHGDADTNAKKRLLGALGSAGTPEAQRALGSILDDTEAPRTMRRDAAVALGLSKQPSEEVELTLEKAMHAPDKDVAETATLALGNTIHTMNTEQSGETADAVEALIDLLQKAMTDGEKTLYLQALGNTGDLRALAAIEPYLTHAEASLRAVATSSLRFMSGSEVDALIIAAMADKDPAVRAAAVGTISSRPVAGLVAALDKLLRGESEVTIRMAIVNAMNIKRKEAPAIDESLAWAAEEDPSSSVRALAKQVLGK
jgi:HEAT repeat protein